MPKKPSLDFEREVTPHLRLLLAMANRLTRNAGAAEDLVQDTLLKAFRARHQYQDGTNFKAWLLAILRNTFLNGYRRQTLQRRLLDGPDADALASRCLGTSSVRALVDLEAGLLHRSLHGALKQALEELPEEFSSVVILADVEEFSYKEIAEAMGCPLGTVMSRLHRGRRLLRARLAQQAIALGILPETEEEAESPTIPSESERKSSSTVAPAVALSDYRKRTAEHS